MGKLLDKVKGALGGLAAKVLGPVLIKKLLKKAATKAGQVVVALLASPHLMKALEVMREHGVEVDVQVNEGAVIVALVGLLEAGRNYLKVRFPKKLSWM